MTLIEANTILTQLKAAYLSAINGKSYTINTGGTARSITKQDAVWLRNEIQYWESYVSNITNNTKGIKTKFIAYE